MIFDDVLRHGWRAILGHRQRSLLTMLGILIGIASVILLTSVGEGTRRRIVSEFTQFGTNLVAVNPGRIETTGVPGALGGTIHPLTLEDADAMFHNREDEVAAKYGLPGKAVLSTWWNLFKEAGSDLTRQKRFDEVAFLEEANKKAIEVGYNFYQIDPMHASSNAGILTLALIFYVLYTLWWGFAIFYIFEGVGMKMKAGAKKEI